MPNKVISLAEILGVPLDEIDADYHLSDAHGSCPESRRIFKEHSPYLTIDHWCRAPRGLMRETLQFLDDKYGSFDRFIFNPQQIRFSVSKFGFPRLAFTKRIL